MVFLRKTKEKIRNRLFFQGKPVVFPRKTKEKIRNLWFSQGKPKKRYVTVGFPKENQRKDIVSAEGWMVFLICLREGLRGPTLACARRRADQGIPGRAATASPLGKKAHARPRTPGGRARQPSQGMSHRAGDSRTRTDPQTLRRNNEHASENSRRKARQPSRGTLGRQRNS